jgi:hypothetical protein
VRCFVAAGAPPAAYAADVRRIAEQHFDAAVGALFQASATIDTLDLKEARALLDELAA